MHSTQSIYMPAAVVAILLSASVALGLGVQIGQTKDELGLKYDLAATVHDSGRVTVRLTIADQGKLKPLDAVSLQIPSSDKSGYSDLSVSLATDKVDGKLVATAHLSRELADRAAIHLQTHSSPNGGPRSDRSWYYYSIPLRDAIKDAQSAKKAAP